jgi:hypothetical protein
MWRDLWATHRRAVVAAIAVTVLLAAGVVWVAIGHRPEGRTASTRPPVTSVEQSLATGDEAPRTAADTQGSAVPTAATGYDHAAWDAIPAVTASTTAAYPPIAANLRTQPDTFVKAFGTELLTRLYATTSRVDLLSWAQSEAAALTITQVPLTGADRNKALIVSLTSPAWDGAPSTLIPSATDWRALASLHATTTVTGVKVGAVPDFPPAQVTLTDPLTMARLFTATVTLHTHVGGKTVTSASSVAFQVVLGTSLHHGRVFGAACTQQFVRRGQS